MWVRGLKQPEFDNLGKQPIVAPHVGAWIETSNFETFMKSYWSHPMWVRGLKLMVLLLMVLLLSRTPCGCVD